MNFKVTSLEARLHLLIISQAMVAFHNRWRYSCLAKFSSTKHAITPLFTNISTCTFCLTICMFIGTMKQSIRYGGKNRPFVSFEVLIFQLQNPYWYWTKFIFHLSLFTDYASKLICFFVWTFSCKMLGSP